MSNANILQLKSYCDNLFPVWRWLLPGGIKTALLHSHLPTATFCRVFEAHTNFITRFFFSGISLFANSSTYANYQSCKPLLSTVLAWRDEEVDFILDHPCNEAKTIIEIVTVLQDTDLLTSHRSKVNLGAIVQKQDAFELNYLLQIVKMLMKGPLLTGDSAETQTNFATIVSFKQQHWFHSLLKIAGFEELFVGPMAQRYFDFLTSEDKDRQNVTQRLILLNRLNLFNGEKAEANWEIVEKADWLESRLQILLELKSLGFLEGEDFQTNFPKVMQHERPLDILSILGFMPKCKPEDPEHAKNMLEAILKHERPYDATNVLECLDKTGLLALPSVQSYAQTMFNNQSSYYLRETLPILEKAGILTEPNFLTTVKSVEKVQDHYSGLPYALRYLEDHELLTKEVAQANFNLAANANYSRPESCNSAINTLQNSGFPKETLQALFTAVVSHREPARIASIFFELQKLGLLREETREAVVSPASSPFQIYQLLMLLENTTLLREERRESNLKYLILYAWTLWAACQDIPPHLLTQVHFDNLIRICEAPPEDTALQAAAIQYVHSRILLRRRARHTTINQEQSTHTASVHATTDLTAWLLSTKYKLQATAGFETFENIQKRIDEWKPADNAETISEQITAAKNCLTRLESAAIEIVLEPKKKQPCLAYLLAEMEVDKSELKHEDLRVRESIEPLLPALGEDANQETRIPLTHFIHWLFQEISKNPASVDYMAAFVNALFEIQRGYNLDEQGRDDKGAEDYSICYGGTANKFCERLSGLSPLIQFIFVNDATIARKVNFLFCELILTALQSLLDKANTGSKEDKEQFCKLICDLQNPDTVEDAYARLYFKDGMLKLLKNEFKAYILLVGTRDLEKELQSFEDSSLPYFRPIDASEASYSHEFKEKFQKFEGARKTFETASLPPDAAQTLSQVGFLSEARGAADSPNAFSPTHS